MEKQIDGKWYEGSTRELYDFRLRSAEANILSGGITILDTDSRKEGTWNLRSALLNDRMVEVMDLEVGSLGLTSYFVQFQGAKMLLSNVQNREIVHELTKENEE